MHSGCMGFPSACIVRNQKRHAIASHYGSGARETVQVVAVGISHNSASVDLRERLTVSADSLTDTLRELREHVGEALILSTCNRVELYAVCGHEASGAELLRQFLASHGDVPMPVVREATYAFAHESAVRHLLRVASGLDSMVLGEDEILGQVRRALAAARHAGTLGPVLDRLGDMALFCGKRARAATSLGRDGESVASVAVRLAMRDCPVREQPAIVVLGAGEAARGVVDHLAGLGQTRVTLVNRTHDRAVSVAEETGATVRAWEDLSDVVAIADIVFACTASPAPILDADLVARARAANPTPFLCVDLGVPRDIDPTVALLDGVRLIDLSRVEAEAARRHAGRTRELVRAESIVGQETERYMDWWRARGVAPTIARLHARASEIREAELERAMARLPDLSPHARTVVRDLAARMVNKLLHVPTVALKRDPEGANMAVAVERLFALGEPVAELENPHQESIAS